MTRRPDGPVTASRPPSRSAVVRGDVLDHREAQAVRAHAAPVRPEVHALPASTRPAPSRTRTRGSGTASARRPPAATASTSRRRRGRPRAPTPSRSAGPASRRAGCGPSAPGQVQRQQARPRRARPPRRPRWPPGRPCRRRCAARGWPATVTTTANRSLSCRRPPPRTEGSSPCPIEPCSTVPSAAVPTCISQRGPVNASSRPYHGKARQQIAVDRAPGRGPGRPPRRRLRASDSSSPCARTPPRSARLVVSICAAASSYALRPWAARPPRAACTPDSTGAIAITASDAAGHTGVRQVASASKGGRSSARGLSRASSSGRGARRRPDPDDGRRRTPTADDGTRPRPCTASVTSAISFFRSKPLRISLSPARRCPAACG